MAALLDSVSTKFHQLCDAIDELEHDLFRDSSVRYLGYCNEVGESFRYMMHSSLVRSSYVVSFGYVLADTAHKTRSSFQRLQRGSSTAAEKFEVAETCLDTVLWQTMATVVVPGLFINRVVAATRVGLPWLMRGHSRPWMKLWVPTVAGLSAIPFIVEPIDHGVHRAMDSTTRKWSQDYKMNLIE